MARLRRDLSPEIQAALAQADQLMLSDPSGNIHSVGWGQAYRKGKSRGNAVVATVKTKGMWISSFTGPRVPSSLNGLPVDVQVQPRQKIQLLYLKDDWRVPGVPNVLIADEFADPQSVHRQCYNTPIPGGVEVFPLGHGWVGTLGVKVVFRDPSSGVLRHGAITNWHVATGTVGTCLGQPGGNGEWFAAVNHSPGVSFSKPNYIDLSVLDIERTDGPYAPVTHTVKAKQVTLGIYKPKLSQGGVGTIQARDGRTLGRLIDGRIAQIGASVRVGYGAGKTALYLDQHVVTRPAGGSFSAPGDSGSMVFEYPSMKPSGLLFAGGGGTTIVSPAEYAVSLSGVTQFA